jgi:hypothetical protein
MSRLGYALPRLSESEGSAASCQAGRGTAAKVERVNQ